MNGLTKCHIHTMAYYSYIKWNRLLLYALYLCVQSVSRISLFASPWTAGCQAPLSMEFSRQEYWSKLPFPVSGDLLEPGIRPPCRLNWQADSSPVCHLGSPTVYHGVYQSEKHDDKREKSQIQETTYCVTAFIRSGQKMSIFGDRKQISCLGLGIIVGIDCLRTWRIFFGVTKMF